MNTKELKMNLEKEFIVEKIYDILNSKNTIKFPLSLQELSELYDDLIYVDKTQYDEQVDIEIYDKDGFELLSISPPFINEYSQEDFLQDNSLLLDLKGKINTIENSRAVVLYNA